MKSPAIIVANESDHIKTMNFLSEKGKISCIRQLPDDIKYDPEFNFVIVNGPTFQWWSDPKTIKKAGYNPQSLDSYILDYVDNQIFIDAVTNTMLPDQETWTSLKDFGELFAIKHKLSSTHAALLEDPEERQRIASDISNGVSFGFWLNEYLEICFDR